MWIQARQHIKVANQRSDFLHKLSKSLTLKYGAIAVEDLKVNEMVRNHHLAKSISDASWNNFIKMLSYKAVAGGGQLVKVEPRGTSKTCSDCGNVIDMPLSKRQFQCLKCGFISHRDLNASLNILNGMGGLPKTLTPVETSSSTTKQLVASAVVEAGTIMTKPSTSSVIESPIF